MQIIRLLSFNEKNRYEGLYKKEDDFHENLYKNWNEKYPIEFCRSIDAVKEMVESLFKIPKTLLDNEQIKEAGLKLRKVASIKEEYKDFIIKIILKENSTVHNYWYLQVNNVRVGLV